MPLSAWYVTHKGKPLFTEDWQVYVFLAVVVIGIIAIIAAIIKFRKL